MRGVCPLSVCGVLLGALWPPLGSPLVVQALLSGSLGSRLVASAPHRCDLASLKAPQQPVGEPKCTVLYNKTNDFAKPPVCQKCFLRAPLGPPRPPLGPLCSLKPSSQNPSGPVSWLRPFIAVTLRPSRFPSNHSESQNVSFYIMKNKDVARLPVF